MTPWSEVYRSTQHSFGARIVKQNAWPLFAASWDPTRHNNFATQPKRKAGRPPKRWEDDLKCFKSCIFLGADAWHDAADSPEMALFTTPLSHAKSNFVRMMYLSLIPLVTHFLIVGPEFLTRTGKVQSAKCTRCSAIGEQEPPDLHILEGWEDVREVGRGCA